MKLLFATTNEGKLSELRELLKDANVELMSLRDVPPQPEIVEDGGTFLENAVKKARGWFVATGLPTLADDSGLCVEALKGEPGVRSARYGLEPTMTLPGSPKAKDRANNQKLLAKLKEVPKEKRGAEFRCVLCLFTSKDGPPVVVSGVCRGEIVLSPRGSDGFGYDPLFQVEGMTRTMAELTREEKNRLSHRARAFAALLPRLEALLGAKGA
jgi:XTP/dITP diphosphohydrolase